MNYKVTAVSAKPIAVSDGVKHGEQHVVLTLRLLPSQQVVRIALRMDDAVELAGTLTRLFEVLHGTADA